MLLPHILPTPRMPDPHVVPAMRWGIIGPGGIAEAWIETVFRNTNQHVVAVASRKHSRAEEFARSWGIAKAYGSYDDLLDDSEVDAVYIATRQHAHHDVVLAAIAAGKHVLVEKPLTILPAEARDILNAAKDAEVLVMEALWSVYLPQADVIRQLLDDRVLGGIRLVHADLGQDQRAAARMWERDGGGASHDMGVYPVAFIRSVLGESPAAINAFGELTELGIDSELSINLRYASGATATACCSMRAHSRTAAWIDGEFGSLELASPFPVPTTLTLFEPTFAPRAAATWTDSSGIVGHEGLCYQVTAFAQFVSLGLTDSPIRPLADAVADVELIAEARQLIGAN